MSEDMSSIAVWEDVKNLLRDLSEKGQIDPKAPISPLFEDHGDAVVILRSDDGHQLTLVLDSDDSDRDTMAFVVVQPGSIDFDPTHEGVTVRGAGVIGVAGVKRFTFQTTLATVMASFEATGVL